MSVAAERSPATHRLYVVVLPVSQPWSKAPDFTPPATTQEKLSLGQLVGKKNVVLFGFIGAFTPT